MRHAIVAGSFDPITNGHVWLIKQALKIADRVTVVVGVNPSKKYMFEMDERIDLVGEVLTNDLVDYEIMRRIEIVPLQNELLVNYAKSVDADVLVRGIRNTTDFSYESEILLINRNIQPTIDTVYVVPPRELTEVSSSTVKGLVGFTGWQNSIKSYVDPSVINALERKSLGRESTKVITNDPNDILAQLKRRRNQLDPIDPVSVITANQQLNSWYDGPKIVLDFMGIIPVNPAKYTHIAITDWSIEAPYVIDYLNRSSSLTTIFVKGSQNEYDLVRDSVFYHINVIKLGRWIPQ
jgi:pantetheine-phosphate adenylyltransferase